MGKQEEIRRIARFIALAAVHKIGGLLNPSAIYAEKYKKEYGNFVQQAENILIGRNWNREDKEEIKTEARKQAHDELKRRGYIAERKFDILDRELGEVTGEMGID